MIKKRTMRNQKQQASASRHVQEVRHVQEARGDDLSEPTKGESVQVSTEEAAPMPKLDGPMLPFHHVSFVKSAVKPQDYPESVWPEIAIVGRSNVGKSSLLNDVLQRKRLAHVSSTPGRTQLINFFNIDHQMLLVDLPGYGFAKVPEAVKRKWRPMIERYLTGRTCLVACLFLLDIRRQPSEEDLQLWSWFEHIGLPFVPVLTKADKLSKSQQFQQTTKIAKALDMPHQGIVVTSAKNHQGKEQMREVMRTYCAQYWVSQAG
ncbi:MAG: ribosome biogenesis GTP-binding protein YihA/YsxC [Myxococcota bacterium]